MIPRAAEARLGLIDTRFFPAPSCIFPDLIAMARSGELAEHTLMSLKRLFWGSLLGGVPAIAFGIVMGLNRNKLFILIVHQIALLGCVDGF